MLPDLNDRDRLSLEWRAYKQLAPDARDPAWASFRHRADVGRRRRKDEIGKATDPPWVIARAEPAGRGDVAVFAVWPWRQEPWLIRGWLRLSSGVLRLSVVSIEHLLESDHEVDGLALKRLPLGAIRQAAIAQAQLQPLVVEMKKRLADASAVRRKETYGVEPSAAGRPRKGEGYHHDLAHRFLDLRGRGASANDAQRQIARELHIAIETVRTQLKVAKNRHGFLEGKQGQPYQAGPNLRPKEQQ